MLLLFFYPKKMLKSTLALPIYRGSLLDALLCWQTTYAEGRRFTTRFDLARAKACSCPLVAAM